jgi:hypothetical protein
MRTILLTASLVACAYGLPSGKPNALLAAKITPVTEGEAAPGGGGMTAFSLTHLEQMMFTHEIEDTLNTDVQEDCDESSKKTYEVKDIFQSEQKVESGASAYRLHCTVAHGSDETGVIVVLTVYHDDPSAFQISKVFPYSFLPQCAIDMIEAEQAEGQNATIASTGEEAALEAAEMDSDVPHVATDGTAALHDAYAKKAALAKETTEEEKHATRETYFLGYVPSKLVPVRSVKRDKTALMLQQRPETYDPFFGTSDEGCLTNFPARNQGSCGSCYAFAMTTAMSLQYCLKMHPSTRTNPTLVFSPQTVVSCGSSIDVDEQVLVDYYNDDYENDQARIYSSPSAGKYNYGCNGGDGVLSLMYMKRFGYPFTLCYPYASGGGDPLHHFDAAQGQEPVCHDTCTGANTAGQSMTTFSAVTWTQEPATQSVGIDVCKGEHSIMDCMIRDGPMFCAFEVYSDFGGLAWAANGPYGKEPYGPAIGATVSGGHAVTCYGWGVEDDGTKYWKCINSWGSWGANNRGEFKMRKGANVAKFEEWGCTTGTLDSSQITGMPPSPPDPPASPPPPLPHSPPAHPPPSPPKDCSTCDNQNTGGRCLMLIPSNECPSVWSVNGGPSPMSHVKTCADPTLEINEDCGSDYSSNEAFGTDASADNCNGEAWDSGAGAATDEAGEARRGGGDSLGHGYDVYRLFECHAPPMPPSSPPPLPASPATCVDTKSHCAPGYDHYCQIANWFRRECPDFCDSRGYDACTEACTDEDYMCYTLNGRNDCGMLTPQTAALFGYDFCQVGCVRNACPQECGGSDACPAASAAAAARTTKAAAASSKKVTKEQLATSKLRVSKTEAPKKSLWCEASCAQSGLDLGLVASCELSSCKDCKGCAK